MTLYVSDLDGTLLNGESQLSDYTVHQLNHLIQEKEVLFSIATARTPATVATLMERVETNLPYIVMAGAAFWDNPQQTYHQVQVIPTSVVASLLAIYADHTIHPFIYRQHGHCIYAHHVPELTVEEESFINHRLTSPLKQLFTAPVLSAEDPDDAMLVYAMGDYNDLRIIADEIDRKGIKCTYMCYHDIFDYALGYLEVYALGTTKAAAIHRLAKDVGATRTVVFGDNLNDIPMMQSATHSVAVANAFPQVKAIADEVIGSNEEDAVVKWIAADLRRQAK